MILWDFLGTCQCTQELYIYLVNDRDLMACDTCREASCGFSQK